VTTPVSSADAAAVAATVALLPEIAGLSGGAVGTVATYLPGDRVVGVRVRGDGIEIHVVAASTTVPLANVADRVRHAVRIRFPGTYAIDVFIDDIEGPRAVDTGVSSTAADGDRQSVSESPIGPETQSILRDDPSSPPVFGREPVQEVSL
jgi:hypothetical protein